MGRVEAEEQLRDICSASGVNDSDLEHGGRTKGAKNCLNRRCIFKVVPIGFPDQLHLPGGFADEFSIRCVRMR